MDRALLHRSLSSPVLYSPSGGHNHDVGLSLTEYLSISMARSYEEMLDGSAAGQDIAHRLQGQAIADVRARHCTMIAVYDTASVLRRLVRNVAHTRWPERGPVRALRLYVTELCRGDFLVTCLPREYPSNITKPPELMSSAHSAEDEQVAVSSPRWTCS